MSQDVEVQVLSRAQKAYSIYNIDMDPKFTKHIAYLVIFLLAIVFGVILVWPFIVVLILSIALAVVFHPVHQWLLKYFTRGNDWVASLLTVILFIVLVCGPLFLIGSLVFNQAQSIYTSLSEGTVSSTFVNRINNIAAHYFPWTEFKLEDKILQFSGAVTSRLGDIASFVFSTVLSLLLMILAMFYFLKDGPHWKKTLVKGSPLSSESTHKIIAKLTKAINGVIKGYLLIAILQGVLLGLGLLVFGIPNPALWGLLAGVASLIPTVGTSLVSVPAIIFLYSTGNTEAAIGLAVWSVLLVGLLDNLLTPIVVGRKINIHPMFILFAVLGGIVLLGPAGILIGPLLVSFIYVLTSVYSAEMK